MKMQRNRDVYVLSHIDGGEQGMGVWGRTRVSIEEEDSS